MSGGSDVVALAVASLVVVAPGGALLLALGVRRPLWWVALTPPASVGVATLTAMASAVLGLPFGPPALAIATTLLAVVGIARLRLVPDAPSPLQWGRWGVRVPGVVLVLAGVGLSVLVWTTGLGSMATVGQEHDLIVHGVLTAYIQQSGHGAPWQLMPADVLTGQDVMFYPAGLHLLMAVTASVTGSTAVGINAVSAVVLGAGWSSGSAVLAYVATRRARLEAAPALVAAGMAAIVAAGLYRPTISLVQWGGTVPNAATLALTPGLLAALLTLPSPAAGWRPSLRPAVAVGVAVAGMLAIHPSAVVTVGVSAMAWWGGEALTGDGRRRFLGQVVPLAAAGIVAAAVAAPMLLAMSRVAAHIGAFQPDIDPLGVGDALHRTLGMTYNVGDPRQKLAVAQWAAAGLALVGAALSLATRRALGAVVAWLAWAVIVVATWVRPGQGVPGLLTNVFYDAQLRVWSHASLFVPTLAGLAVALLATTLAAHAPVPRQLTNPVARILGGARPWPDPRPGSALAPAADLGTATGPDAPVLLAVEPDPARPSLAPRMRARPRAWGGRGWAAAVTVEPDSAHHPRVGRGRARMWFRGGRGRTDLAARRSGAPEARSGAPEARTTEAPTMALPGEVGDGVSSGGDVGVQAERQPKGRRVGWLPRWAAGAGLVPDPAEPGVGRARARVWSRRVGWSPRWAAGAGLAPDQAEPGVGRASTRMWSRRGRAAGMARRTNGATGTGAVASTASRPGQGPAGVDLAEDIDGKAEQQVERRAWTGVRRRLVAAALRSPGRAEAVSPAGSVLLAGEPASAGGPVDQTRPRRGWARWWHRNGSSAANADDGGAVVGGPGTAVAAAGGAGSARERRGGWVGVAVGGVLALGYLVGPGYRYSRTDVEALASRYARPEYTRVSASDQQAVDWLADQVAPGERVLNSANDGSTLLYVDRRVPIVNVASLGSAAEPDTYRLLQGFNRYPDDPEVRRMLRDLDVRWVYVDSSAPTISASGAPEAWVAGNWLSVPEGFRHLAGLPGLERRFRSGTVSIYHLDPAVLG